MSRIFFTSDPHYRHRKVAMDRVRNRPDVFGDHAADFAVYDADSTSDEGVAAASRIITVHDAEIARRWDSVIIPDDIVYIVGDICVGDGRGCDEAIDIIAERPGRKRFVAGNHDPVHSSHRKRATWTQRFRAVFETIDSWTRIKIGTKDVMVCHYPYNGDHTPEDRDVQYRMRDCGAPIIHGHTHSPEQVSFSNEGTIQVHVGVDAWDFTPVEQGVVVQIVKDAGHW